MKDLHRRPIGEYIGFLLSFSLFTAILFFVFDRRIVYAVAIAIAAVALGSFLKRLLV